MTVARDEPTVVPPIDHGEAMVLAETAYSRFADLVEALGPDDWTLPTDCEGWTVRDLVGHVAGAMRAAASMRELARQQMAVRRRARRSGRDQVDEMTALQIELTAGLSVAELTDEVRSSVGPATAGRARTPGVVRRAARFEVVMGPVSERWSIGYLVDVILTRDTWLHRIDLSRAIGADPVITADHDGRIVADVVAEWARRHGRPCRLELSGPAGGSFTFGAVGDADGSVVEALDAVEMDAVELCRVLSGRVAGKGLLATPVPF